MMDCRRIQKLLPLYVEGDLDRNAEVQIDRHLKACSPCKIASEALTGSQGWLRASAQRDFDEEIIDSIRVGVMAEISRSRMNPSETSLNRWLASHFPWRLRSFALAAVVILGVLGLAGLYAVSHRSAPEPPRQARDEAARPGAQGPAPAVRDERTKSAPERRETRLTTYRRHRAPEEQPAVAAVPGRIGSPGLGSATARANPDEGRLRIEIQTADPNIRIIWFAPKQVPAETNIEPEPVGDTR